MAKSRAGISAAVRTKGKAAARKLVKTLGTPKVLPMPKAKAKVTVEPAVIPVQVTRPGVEALLQQKVETDIKFAQVKAKKDLTDAAVKELHADYGAAFYTEEYESRERKGATAGLTKESLLAAGVKPTQIERAIALGRKEYTYPVVQRRKLVDAEVAAEDEAVAVELVK
jgi:hypothetical protein